MRVAQCRRPQATDALRLLLDASSRPFTAFDFAAQICDQEQAVSTARQQFGIELDLDHIEPLDPPHHTFAAAAAIDLLRVA
eukprot:SAG11_NODE_1084_length_5941_cov_5.761897_1_plen_81_part_00